MSELINRIEKVEESLVQAQNAIVEHGHNGLVSLDNVRRLIGDVKLWAKHVESAAEQGATVRMSDGGPVYCRD